MNKQLGSRSGGWSGIVLGVMLIAWASHSLIALVSGDVPAITIKSVRISGTSAILAASIMAAAGCGMLLAGLHYLRHCRRGA